MNSNEAGDVYAVIANFASSQTVPVNSDRTVPLRIPDAFVCFAAPELFCALDEHAEIALRNIETLPKCDIFALGMTLYVMIAEHRPWPTVTRDAIIEKTRNGERPPVDQIPTTLLEEFKSTLDVLWNQDPNKRPNAADIP